MTTVQHPFGQFQYPTAPLCVSLDVRTRSLRSALGRVVSGLNLNTGGGT
jgi:hypothetical protein